MLKKALEELYNKPHQTTRELAERLKVSEATAKLMLEELERQGYLTSRPLQCPQECASCPLRSSCAILGGGRLWLLDRDKARRVLEGTERGS